MGVWKTQWQRLSGGPGAGLLELITGLARTCSLMAPGRGPRGWRPARGVGDRPCTQLQAQHVPAQLHRPLVADVVGRVQIDQQRFDSWAERGVGREPGRRLRGRARPTVRTRGLIPQRLEHHRPHYRELGDLALADQALASGWQLCPTPTAGGRPTTDRRVRDRSGPAGVPACPRLGPRCFPRRGARFGFRAWDGGTTNSTAFSAGLPTSRAGLQARSPARSTR